MSLACTTHGRSDVGRLRQANEDRLAIEVLPDGSTLLVVCDGMGGHEGGQVASEVASAAITEGVRARTGLPPPQALFESMMLAHEAVRREALARSLTGMGTTAVVAWVIDTKAWVGWVGDSRLYQMREGRIVEKTLDHTKVQRLISEGRLAPIEAATHPEAHVLERALGGAGVLEPEVWNESLDLEMGDVLLLCTDGLHDMLSDAILYRLIEGKTADEATLALIERANTNGGHDNATAVLAVMGGTRIPQLPDLEDTESGDRPVVAAANRSRQQSAEATKRSGAMSTWKSVPAGPGGVPLWALAFVAIGALALGLALGLRMGRSAPAETASAAPP